MSASFDPSKSAEWKRLESKIRWRVRSIGWDEDFGQAALLGVWEFITKGGSLDEPLLIVVGHRRYIDALRRSNGRSYRMQTRVITYRPRPEHIHDDIVDPTSRTDFETIDAVDAFERAIERLSSKHRGWVLELIGLQALKDAGGSLAELAEAQGLSRSALAVRIHDRRERLAGWVEGWAA